MAKKIIRLTESDLHRIIKESTKKVIKEFFFSNDGTRMSDEDWLNDADDEDDYNNRESALMDRQYYSGENAMDYHPQRTRSSLFGDDFASSYAKDPMFNDHNKIDRVTNNTKKMIGF